MTAESKSTYGKIVMALVLAPMLSVVLGATPSLADCECRGTSSTIGSATDQADCTSKCPQGDTCTCVSSAAAPIGAGGANANAPTSYPLENPLGAKDLSIPTLVGRAIKIFTGVSGSFALLMFIYGGVLWIFSGGSPERVQKGKDVMKWAVIGMLVMFSAYGLVNLVFQGLGAAGTK